MRVPGRKGGGTRESHAAEAFTFVLSALAAVNRWAGVRVKNARDADGNIVAIAVIPGARFDERSGKTELNLIDTLQE